MKYKLLLVLVINLWFIFSTESYAQTTTAYISDDKHSYLRAGPGDNWRFVGNVNAGEQIQVIDPVNQNGFIKILTVDGREGWILEEDKQTNKSIKTLLPETQEELAQSKDRISELEENIIELKDSIAELQNDNSVKQLDLGDLNKKVEELQKDLSTKELDIQIRWLINGGGLALGSIVLGILITYLPKKRRRSDGWAD